MNFSGVSKVSFSCFNFGNGDWLKNLTPPSFSANQNDIRRANGLFTRVFPRFAPVARICFVV